MSTSYAIGDYSFLDDTGIFFGTGLDSKIYFDGADLIIASQNVTAADEVHFVDWTGVDFGAAAIATSGTLGAGASTLASAVIGGATNKTTIDASGDISQAGTARRNWVKYTANSLDPLAPGEADIGTLTGTVANLQTAHDGSFLAVQEATGTPGIRQVVQFTSVTAFNWVNVIAQYDGTATHALAVQLYNWAQTRWDTFDALQSGQEDVTNADGYILCNHDFTVPDDAEYIGTGGDAGKVWVRFYHTMAGNASHDLYIDVCALYQ